MTIYEVIYGFWEDLFTVAIFAEYQDLFEPLSVVMTVFLVFGFILIPLWKIGTFFLRKVK